MYVYFFVFRTETECGLKPKLILDKKKEHCRTVPLLTLSMVPTISAVIVVITLLHSKQHS